MPQSFFHFTHIAMAMQHYYEQNISELSVNLGQALKKKHILYQFRSLWCVPFCISIDKCMSICLQVHDTFNCNCVYARYSYCCKKRKKLSHFSAWNTHEFWIAIRQLCMQKVIFDKDTTWNDESINGGLSYRMK